MNKKFYKEDDVKYRKAHKWAFFDISSGNLVFEYGGV